MASQLLISSRHARILHCCSTKSTGRPRIPDIGARHGRMPIDIARNCRAGSPWLAEARREGGRTPPKNTTRRAQSCPFDGFDKLTAGKLILRQAQDDPERNGSRPRARRGAAPAVPIPRTLLATKGLNAAEPQPNSIRGIDCHKKAQRAQGAHRGVSLISPGERGRASATRTAASGAAAQKP